MDDTIIEFPSAYKPILDETKAVGFNQLSDGKVGAFLAAICASKPQGKFVELGTGTGLCTSWMLQGMCCSSSLVTVDNDDLLVAIARKHLGHDPRVKFTVGTGEDLIENIKPLSVDLIFADTWPGKYNHLEETLCLLKISGIYIIDDMLPQENWPEGHSEKANLLINNLSTRKDFVVTKMCWSTGVLMCTKTS